MKACCIALLTMFCTLFLSGGRSEAYIGYGYRANEPVRVDRCYRGFAWDYAVPFYIFGLKGRHYRDKCNKLYHGHWKYHRKKGFKD